jgi:hypothetical protein
MRTIGTCSVCGGPVMVEDPWFGVVPPVPRCKHCGATARNPFGPTIPMEPKPFSQRDKDITGPVWRWQKGPQ